VPSYDYVCSACGHRMEVVHGIHGHGPETCPVCGGRMLKAVVAPAVHFKGSGWAKKDRGVASSTRAAAKAAAGGDEGSPGGAASSGGANGSGGASGSGGANGSVAEAAADPGAESTSSSASTATSSDRVD
jgi:putative FmdB family regulatory protein